MKLQFVKLHTISKRTFSLDSLDIRLNLILFYRNKYIEKDLHRSCVEKLEANTILKDDNITPELMIECMNRLLKSNIKFKQLNLHITSYYSILSDGTICIPWNFKD